MELLFNKSKKTLIVSVFGEIDHCTSMQIRAKVESAFNDLGGKNIVFNFEEVSFMDSSGIGMLIGRYKQIHALGGRIAIAAVKGKTEEILQLSGLKKIIPVFEKTDDAIRYTEGGKSDEI